MLALLAPATLQATATIDKEKMKTLLAAPLAPGAGVSIFGSGLLATAMIKLANEDPKATGQIPLVKPDGTPDSSGLKFVVPAGLATGRYTVTVEDKNMDPPSLPVGTPLTVQPKAEEGKTTPTTPAKSAPSVATTFSFPVSASPGDKIRIDGTFSPGATGTLSLKPIGREAAPIPPINGSASDNGVGFAVVLPASLLADRYAASLTIDGRQDLAVPGEIRISQPPIKVTGIFPATGFPGTHGGGFDFDILGENFPRVAERIQVIVEGQGEINFARRLTPEQVSAVLAKGECPQYPCLMVVSERKLSVLGYKPVTRYQGPLQVRVRGNDVTSDPAVPAVLARFGSVTVLVIALLVLGGLLAVIFLLVRRGVGNYEVGGVKYGPLYSFLIDKDTNTYSLSKLQLFVFSLVTLFSYVYVFLSRILVQWNFTFPEVPSSFPTLLGISAGTSIASMTIAQSHGNKSSGAVRPSAADLISDGGVVTPERFQLLVWTLVAAIGYVVLVVLQDPAVTKFPDIPQGLLYLTGVSAAAYAGGKLVRDPGPIARTVSKAQIKGDNIDFTVVGENLPKDASYRIDGAAVTVDPASVTCTAQNTSTQLCTQLTFTVQKANAYQKEDHVLQVVSSDGRMAEFQFTADPPKIDNVMPKPLPKGSTSVPLTITGSSFRANSKVQWLPPSAAQALDLVPDSQSATQIVVKVVPGSNSGSGTITVTAPSGLKAVASVDIA